VNTQYNSKKDMGKERKDMGKILRKIVYVKQQYLENEKI